jgi:hypothetical protein
MVFANTNLFIAAAASPTATPAAKKSSTSSSSVAVHSTTSTQPTSSSSPSSTTATCSPTPIPKRTYKVDAEKGLGWTYFNDVQDNENNDETISSNESVGVQQCEQICSADVNCRTLSYFIYADETLGAGCLFFPTQYNASYFSYDPNVTSPLNYTKVLSVTNWSPPAELLPNGDFERGCLDPWWETSRPSIFIGVVPCNKKVPGDCLSGNYYLLLNGTDPAREGFGGANVQPVVLPNREYKFTGYVKGAVGSTQEQLSIWFETMDDIPTYTGTGKWELVEFNFNGSTGGVLTVTAEATKTGGLVDWKVDKLQIEEISG